MCILFQDVLQGGRCWCTWHSLRHGVGKISQSEVEFSKQAHALDQLAWNNTIGLWPILSVCGAGTMIVRDSLGQLNLIVRGEMLGIMKGKILGKKQDPTRSQHKLQALNPWLPAAAAGFDVHELLDMQIFGAPRVGSLFQAEG